MKIDCMLTLLIKLADCYDLPLEVNLVEKMPLGYWTCVSFEDTYQFYKMFQYMEMSLNNIILHKSGMPLDTCASEIKKALDNAVQNLRQKQHAEEP